MKPKEMIHAIVTAILTVVISWVGFEVRSSSLTIREIRTELNIVKPADVLRKVNEIDKKVDVLKAIVEQKHDA